MNSRDTLTRQPNTSFSKQFSVYWRLCPSPIPVNVKVLAYGISHQLWFCFWFALFCAGYMIYSYLSHVFDSLISFMVASLSMRQLYDCQWLPNSGKVILIDRFLTHWGRVTHICVGNLTIIGSDNGLSPGRRQAITWTNVGILLIGPLGTNFSEMLIKLQTFSFKKIYLKMSSGKWRPFCLGGLNVLTTTKHNKTNFMHISECTCYPYVPY